MRSVPRGGAARFAKGHSLEERSVVGANLKSGWLRTHCIREIERCI